MATPKQIFGRKFQTNLESTKLAGETNFKLQDWANKTDSKKVTGMLMWDLSAAFDTLYHEILGSKLEIYGFSENAIKWMRSYLSGRSQWEIPKSLDWQQAL